MFIIFLLPKLFSAYHHFSFFYNLNIRLHQFTKFNDDCELLFHYINLHNESFVVVGSMSYLTSLGCFSYRWRQIEWNRISVIYPIWMLSAWWIFIYVFSNVFITGTKQCLAKSVPTSFSISHHWISLKKRLRIKNNIEEILQQNCL